MVGEPSPALVVPELQESRRRQADPSAPESNTRITGIYERLTRCHRAAGLRLPEAPEAQPPFWAGWFGFRPDGAMRVGPPLISRDHLTYNHNPWNRVRLAIWLGRDVRAAWLQLSRLGL
jgi:hypothetical protein